MYDSFVCGDYLFVFCLLLMFTIVIPDGCCLFAVVWLALGGLLVVVTCLVCCAGLRLLLGLFLCLLCLAV